MHIGGVILAAGMVMGILEGDYLDGSGPITFMLSRVIGTRHERGTDWVILEGLERPSAAKPWRERRIHVRVAALRRSLTLV